MSDFQTKSHALLYVNFVGLFSNALKSKFITDMDSTIECSKCSKSVSVSLLKDHQDRHEALSAMKYKKGKCKLQTPMEVSINFLEFPEFYGPSTIDALLRRRRLMIKKLIARFKDNPSHPELLKKIVKINESFEIVRSDLLRGMSICNSVSRFIARSSIREGGLSADEEDRVKDIRSNAVYSATTSGLPQCVQAIGTCEARNIATRDVMEDRSIVVCGFASLEKDPGMSHPSCFVGVYDGHEGPSAAEQSCQQFHGILADNIERERTRRTSVAFEANGDELIQQLDLCSKISESDPGQLAAGEHANNATSSNLIDYAAILRCFHNTYRKVDERLSYGIRETSWARWSGCSATTCAIADERRISTNNGGHNIDSSGDGSHLSGETPGAAVSTSGRIFCSNAGDVEAYIWQDDRPYPLTRKHTAHDDAERRRVEAQGGRVVVTGRSLSVNSVSATTRGLGNHGDPALRKCVISAPFTATAAIGEHSQFVVLATSSVWSALGVDEIAHIVRSTPSQLSSASILPMPMTMLYKQRRKERKRHDDGSDDATADSDSVQDQHPSKLASIVETDEELCDTVEEVIIVSAQNDDDASSFVSSNCDLPLLANTDVSSTKTTEITESKQLDERQNCQAGEEWSKEELVQSMCERVVRAAQTAGAIENLSVVIILLSGFDYSSKNSL